MDMLVRLYALPAIESAVMPKGYVVRRAQAYDKVAVEKFTAKHFLRWVSEVDVSFSKVPIGCLLAVREKTNTMVGFACCDTTALGYFGPTGVAEKHRGLGLGKALLIHAMHDLRARGYGYAIIGGAGPAEFYRKTVGAIEIPDSAPGIYTRPVKVE
jgi:GNAT superfamily N-acetyltransferase